MFQNVVPLSKSTHAALRLSTNSSYGFAASQVLTGVVGAELHKAAMVFPLAFVPQQDGSFALVAVMGYEQNRNLYVAPDGRWLGEYIPASLRGYPFLLVQAGAEGEGVTVCIDSACSRFSQTEGEALFNDAGEMSGLTRKIVDFLLATEENRKATVRAVAALAAAKLMVPWEFKINVDDQHRSVGGLYRIDEAALNALPDEAFIALRRAGALPLAWTQLLSMGRTDALVTMTRIQKSLESQLAARPKLDQMLDFGQNDDINFDFGN